MATAAATVATAAPRVQSAAPARREGVARASWIDNAVTTALALWLTVGVFVDGWAHNNLRLIETFFTPWHALLYSGFGACALWIFWLVLRNHRAGYVGTNAIPHGYREGLAGVFIFGAAGIGDMLWHTLLGIEQNIDALLSPTHLLLFLGAVLVLTSAVRSAWAEPGNGAPTFVQFFPALVSLTFSVSFASFMSMYLWGLGSGLPFRTPQSYAQFGRAARGLMDDGQVAGLSGIVVTNAMLIAPLLLMLRRWRVPFGGATLYLTLNTALMQGLRAFSRWEIIAVALATGLIADLLIWRLRPSPVRPWAFRIVAVAVPLVLWSLYFLVEGRLRPLGWSTELWSGIIVWCGLSGLGISVMMAPPASPQAQETLFLDTRNSEGVSV